MDQIIKVAWDLNENSDNRYRLVYEIAELAKKLVDETQMKKARDEFGFEEVVTEGSYKKENPVEHAIMVKASESDNTELVGLILVVINKRGFAKAKPLLASLYYVKLC